MSRVLASKLPMLAAWLGLNSVAREARGGFPGRSSPPPAPEARQPCCCAPFRTRVDALSRFGAFPPGSALGRLAQRVLTYAPL